MALFDGDRTYEYNILLSLVLYLMLHCVMVVLSKRVGYPFSMRPTIVCGTLHATGTAASATVLLVLGDRRLIWQRLVMPLSIAYFLADILWYCVPTGDLTMSLHHLVMIGCHYPLGESNGALVAGAGDAEWCLWLSMIGYLSEWTTVFLNLRWVLAHSLNQHHKTFGAVSLCLLTTYAYRLFLFPYLLLLEIIPRYNRYAQRQQVLTFCIMVLGHLIVLQLSIQWIAVILRFGVGQFLVFTPKLRMRHKGPFDWRQSAFTGHNELERHRLR